jgi:pimeloyl-ACP methyl ester carboxylesterase
LCQQDRSAAALILHAPFASVFRVVLPRWCCGAAAPAPARSWSLIGDKFCNVDRMRDITCPVLIAHGQKDAIVPFWHGMALLKQRRRAVAADSSSSSSATASTAVSSAPATCPSEAELFTTPGMHHNYWETKSDEEKFVGALNAFLDNHISVRQRWWTSKQT